MIVYVDIRQKASVNPLHVIEQLIENEIGWRGWITENDGKFYRGGEESAGSHSYDVTNEITKEQYDYVIALQLIRDTLIQRK